MVLQFFVLIIIYYELTVVSLRGYCDLLVFFNRCSMPPCQNLLTKEQSYRCHVWVWLKKVAQWKQIFKRRQIRDHHAKQIPFWLCAVQITLAGVRMRWARQVPCPVLTCLCTCLHMATKHNSPGRWTQLPSLPPEKQSGRLLPSIFRVLYSFYRHSTWSFSGYIVVLFLGHDCTEAIYIPFLL